MELEYNYECLLSILVENQPSILTRIVGLLTRRGFVINSLAVGTTEYDGLSRIVIALPGNLRMIDQVTRQLYKIFPTVKVFNLTNIPSITRELILIKILASIEERRQILEIAKIFNANIVDCTNRTVTLEITGDAKKIVAIEQMLHKFGILEKVRTGKIGLTIESITTGQLYKVERESLRRKMINSHVIEIETKLYL
jgi:acetolactate synthase-1/3 small subunit|uniref:Acetolactate synthase small subunit n=1 Tax=Acanthoceras zachariasii TaxID=451788 RepID=A0A2U9NU12_9STRA|nr:acetohydroxyacid synthetase small subunit [Acanthoceras zachariasii]AWT40492.1 acetohydroxyacid synthetase small subunit [Acanthoceras zachariasii]